MAWLGPPARAEATALLCTSNILPLMRPAAGVGFSAHPGEAEPDFISIIIAPVSVSVKPLQASAGESQCMFLQRTDMSCSHDFASLMERAMEKLNTEQTYAVEWLH